MFTSTRCCCRHWSCVLLWWCEERIARIVIQRHIVKLGLFCTHTGTRTCQYTMLLLHAPLSYRCSFRSLSTVVAHATTNYTQTHTSLSSLLSNHLSTTPLTLMRIQRLCAAPYVDDESLRCQAHPSPAQTHTINRITSQQTTLA